MTHSTSWRSSGGGWVAERAHGIDSEALVSGVGHLRALYLERPQHLVFPVHPFPTASPDVTDATGQRPRVHAAAGTIRRLSVLRVTPHPRRRRALGFTTVPVFAFCYGQ